MLSKRDLGVKYITEGATRYNSSNQYETKKSGYDIYIKGVQFLLEAAKCIIYLFSNDFKFNSQRRQTKKFAKFSKKR